MSESPHQELLLKVAERLSDSGTHTDHLLLTRWKVIGLAQYVIGSPNGRAVSLCVEALKLYAQDGAEKHVDDALQDAGKAVVEEISMKPGVLPTITPSIREDVHSHLEEYVALGNAAIERASGALTTLQSRLQKETAGALQAGIRHRLDLVAAIMMDESQLSEHRQRAAAAVLYLYEIHDAVPDTLGLIGLLDDDFALQVVLDEFDGYDEDEKTHWAERISCELWDDVPFLQGVHLQYDGSPVATTWLDRINSYLSYKHVLNETMDPIILVQPSVGCSPLHSIISLIGLLVFDGLTSSKDMVELLHEGGIYAIDGEFYARYDGVFGVSPVPSWLRLSFRDGTTVCRPPTLADRMVLVENVQLSSARTFSDYINTEDAEPIQRFFDWPEAIGAASISSRILLVTSKQRAQELFEGVKSNNVSLLENRLVQFTGYHPSPDILHTALVLVVPNLEIVRQVVDMDDGIRHTVLIDGYERLHRERYHLPLLQLSGESSPTIIVWSTTGYYPDKAPSWLPPHRHLEVMSDDLSNILELDGDLHDAMAPAQESLWEAATGAYVERIHVPLTQDEVRIYGAIEAFLEIVRDSSELTEYQKYNLFWWAATLRVLVFATASHWVDIQEFVRKWDMNFEEQLDSLYPYAVEQLAPVSELRNKISSTVHDVAADRNSKADALVAFCKEQQTDGWQMVCDRREQVKVASRFAHKQELNINPVVLRDLKVCQNCVVIGWSRLSFVRKLQAHTPRKLVVIVNDYEQEKWDGFVTYKREPNAESLLTAVGYRAIPPVDRHTAPASTFRPASTSSQIEKLDDLLKDDEPAWSFEKTSDEGGEQLTPCEFIWLVDEPRGKVLARDSHVLVESNDHVRERYARSLVAEDRVILGSGAGRWSPADEFTEAVVHAVNASNPELVRNAREWRVTLRKLQADQGWSLEQLQQKLADVEVHRELTTLEGWLDIEQAAPIGPKDIRSTLSSIWELAGDQAEPTVDQVIESCKHLRSLRLNAGRALLNLWKGHTVDMGVDEAKLAELVERLRQEVQVHVVEAVSYGMIPKYMLGSWVTPELALSLESVQQDTPTDEN